MKHLLAMAVLFITASCFSQPNNDISIGKIDTVRSKILHETRRIWVHVPASANNKMFSRSTYPVLYLLDGPAHFSSVMGMMQQLSTINSNTVVPEMIIIGIQNTDRTRDLTPTHSTTSPFGQTADMMKTSGGADNFLAFIEKELIPYVDSTYPVSPYRMLVGHSFGGLFVTHTMLNKPALFNAYVALDPSLWWDDQSTLKKLAVAFEQNRFPAKPFYLAVANTLKTTEKMEKVEKDTTQLSVGMRSGFQLGRLIDKYKKANQPWHWKYYPDDSHGSVALIGEYDALRTFFKDYNLQLPADPEDMNAALFENHYKNVSALMGYKVGPGEARINNLGYMMMRNGKMDKAYDFFKLNIANYPASYVVWDSMGDYYVAKGDKEKAIEHFTKALSIKETADTRQKLEKLTKAN